MGSSCESEQMYWASGCFGALVAKVMSVCRLGADCPRLSLLRPGHRVAVGGAEPVWLGPGLAAAVIDVGHDVVDSGFVAVTAARLLRTRVARPSGCR